MGAEQIKVRPDDYRVGHITNKGFLVGITPRYGLFGFGDTKIKWHEIEPVQLTDSMLLRSGFEQMRDEKNVFQLTTKIERFTITLYKYGNDYDWQFGDMKIATINYFHEFQDIYKLVEKKDFEF